MTDSRNLAKLTKERNLLPHPFAPSAIDVKPEDRLKVLLALLQINRQEIREWQKSLFEVSLWFNAGILGLAAFVHGRDNRSMFLIVLVGLGIGCLGGFYIIFSGVARRAIEISGNDLIKFQRALRLDEQDYYLLGDAIYRDMRTWLPQDHVNSLRALNVTVCILAILSLVLRAVATRGAIPAG